MKCTNKIKKGLILLFVFATTLSGCGKNDYAFEYSKNHHTSSFNIISSTTPQTFETFASDICVVTDDITSNYFSVENDSAAGLFDVKNNTVIYAKDANEMLYPASLTKVMTALVAIKNANMDDILVATDAVKITESGATLIGLKSGDTMTLNQALHILLINSSNDVANLIAENVGGDIDTFVQMMNEEAIQLGATNTNFTNPHGLSDSNHYTTVYDMYLIFNEAIKYDIFNEIIHMQTYETVYYDSRGREKEVDIMTTNLFLRGNYTAPNNMTVVGGKTGTTDMSGHCLMILAKDTSGNPYIGIILRASSRDLINKEMVEMLSEISK